VVVKLGRVLMLAAVTAWVSRQERHRLLAGEAVPATLPPVVPGFVAGFLAVVVLHSFVPVPSWSLDLVAGAQTLLLSAAMFALGAGVRVGQLRRGGLRPLLLGGFATLWVGAVGLVGAVLVS
jgi:uncharacterized membrane protein YadS